MSIPVILGALFLIGLATDLIGQSTFLPRVTLLLLSGLAVGPAGFAVLPEDFIAEWFPAMTGIALALVGFLLGHKLSISELKKHGAEILSISLCKVFGAWLAVGIALLLFGIDPVIVLLLAGIAPATAPAATYDVVQESRATGEFPNTLLSVVALDDIWGLLIFIVMMALASMTTGDVSVGSGIAASLLEIGGSVVLGIALGVPMAYLTGRIRPGEPTLAEALGFILLAAGVAEWLGVVPILTAMVMGITVASMAVHHERPFHAIEDIDWPIMILFFILAGASLETDQLRLAGGLTAIYVVARFVGIYLGARTGGRLADASPAIRKWLGLALLPQAGVAIGMALLAAQRFGEAGSTVLTVVVASTIILETIGPIVARQAIRAATTPPSHL